MVVTAEEAYQLYLDKYCESKGISKEEAEKHLIVQDIKKMYQEQGTVRVN